ncbi:Rrf2 family transcriptional regulator [Agrobacterium tumefaciens]|uniref:Siderophore biosynthesis protein n=1 Tax=Agrobacterium tumefaciens TaxID=358 RepID=A0A2L2LIF2_AGRTU|nr:Rrf2 family transcriptional regulator [Agrobacterium tumefaciens]AVH44113.1 siderophore biosynthesis protein [Agrobacterium tumefaciens]NSY98037.1 Rrf2 family transcriptional regulator [Agrobacterium tumefaciens]NSZ03810.1 Rrf2 family transcriptional regulator [Agrobacterium tumefaciens]NSZ39366.1 Rrf2 family transcriptional regulator [Agrobacterium tumefaciens]NTB04571.1 Rrf2 family transcriptional regulator [Agrobacterium tumefaciens]
MRLKRQSEIAIGILTVFARSPSTKFSAQQLAQEVGATRDNAYQVLALLVRNGFLSSDRGPGGGVRLARDPSDIRLVDVLLVTQPELDASAEETGPGKFTGQPLLDNIVAAASSFFVRLLDRFTVADLVASPDGSGIACLDCHLMKALPARERLMQSPPPPLIVDDGFETGS